jgi:hypothetical protein
MLVQHNHFSEIFQQFSYQQHVKSPTTEAGSCLDLVWTDEHLALDIAVSVVPSISKIRNCKKITLLIIVSLSLYYD